MTHVYRKCFKCGANQVSDLKLRMHRFPALEKNNSNMYQLLAWAMFCQPENDWFNLEALAALNKSCKVICSKHFEGADYTTDDKIRLHRHAIPTLHENNENIPVPTTSPIPVDNRRVLHVRGQIMSEETAATSKSLPIKKEEVMQFQSMPSTSFSEIHDMQQEKPQVVPEKLSRVPLKRATPRTNKIQNLTTSERKLFHRCKYLLKKVSRLKNELKQKKSFDILQILHSNDDVTALTKLKISPSLALLLQGELQNGQRKLRGRRWNENQKCLAVELYKKSPRTYKLLGRLFCLPSPTTIRRLLGHFNLKPGINTILFDSIKKSADKNPGIDNVCFLTFDEMSIMKNINYNQKSDEIQGYQDHGKQGKSKVFASHALVFMLVWIRSKKKQPIAYYLSGDYVTADRLTVLIKEVLHECMKTGINLSATVCDMDGVNVRALENLGSTVEKPYFEFEGHEVITLPDPPHLLKCFRNLFMTYDVKLPMPVQSTTTADNTTTGTGTASWKHLEQFFELDNSNPHFVFAPKLTKRHLQPNSKEKMRVKLASQTFSHSAAMGIYAKASNNELPANAIATATFLEHFNNLFDLLNANSADREDGKQYKTNWTANSPHKDFIKKSKKFITEIEFIGAKRKPPSQQGWLKLLNGYERLWDNLNTNYKMKSLSTRRINQDPLENLFGCIRSNCGSNDNPTTVAQFVAGLKTSIISNLRNVSSNKNCEDDNGELLENFKYLFSKSTENKNNEKLDLEPSASDEICVSDEEIEDSAETQACAYVCGFIFKKYAKNCELCKKAMLTDKPTEIHQFTEFKEYVAGKHSLQYANNSFIACVEKSAELVNKFLKDNPHSDNIKNNCIKIMRENINFNFLNVCTEHLLANKKMIEQSTAIILIKRFCVLENRKFSSELAQKRLAKKIKILKNK